MSDDLLSQMTSALAEEHDGATAAPEATRSRVVRTLAERKPRRRKWLALGIPVLALFGGSTAWAAATGNLPEVVEQAVAVFLGEAETEQVAETTPKKGSTWSAPARPVPIAELPEEAAEPEEEKTQSEDDKTSFAPPEKSRKPPIAVDNSRDISTSAQGPTEDHTDLLTYQAAHRAHFKQGDCAGAVRGYRKYLQEQPAGTFALEAKYNLGVCLVRLGQKTEAKTLLEPFANGVYGDYRQDSAKKLIDAL